MAVIITLWSSVHHETMTKVLPFTQSSHRPASQLTNQLQPAFFLGGGWGEGEEEGYSVGREAHHVLTSSAETGNKWSSINTCPFVTVDAVLNYAQAATVPLSINYPNRIKETELRGTRTLKIRDTHTSIIYSKKILQ